MLRVIGRNGITQEKWLFGKVVFNLLLRPKSTQPLPEFLIVSGFRCYQLVTVVAERSVTTRQP
jgi:hypothetical protein